MKLLGYTYSFDVVKRGYKFVCDRGMSVFVYRVFKVFLVRSTCAHIYHSIYLLRYNTLQTQEPYRVSTSVPISNTSNQWIIELASPLIPQEQVLGASEEINSFAGYFKELIELKPVDHTLLNNRIQYNVV